MIASPALKGIFDMIERDWRGGVLSQAERPSECKGELQRITKEYVSRSAEAGVLSHWMRLVFLPCVLPESLGNV